VPWMFRRHPNMHGDLSAGSGFNALKRNPEYAARFLEEFQDRLYFGTDICSADADLPLAAFLLDLLERGRLSQSAFDKIARGNALRLLGLERVQSKRLLKKIVAEVRKGGVPQSSLEDPKNGVISITDDGFSVQQGPKVLAEVRWEDVDEIRAYKADLFATDLMCWGFCISGQDSMVEVNEEMAGFKALVDAAELRYGMNWKAWWEKVAYPASATNMTVLWRKT